MRGALHVLRSHVWCLLGRARKGKQGPGLLLSSWMSQVPLRSLDVGVGASSVAEPAVLATNICPLCTTPVTLMGSCS